MGAPLVSLDHRRRGLSAGAASRPREAAKARVLPPSRTTKQACSSRNRRADDKNDQDDAADEDDDEDEENC